MEAASGHFQSTGRENQPARTSIGDQLERAGGARQRFLRGPPPSASDHASRHYRPGALRQGAARPLRCGISHRGRVSGFLVLSPIADRPAAGSALRPPWQRGRHRHLCRSRSTFNSGSGLSLPLFSQHEGLPLSGLSGGAQWSGEWFSAVADEWARRDGGDDSLVLRRPLHGESLALSGSPDGSSRDDAVDGAPGTQATSSRPASRSQPDAKAARPVPSTAEPRGVGSSPGTAGWRAPSLVAFGLQSGTHSHGWAGCGHAACLEPPTPRGSGRIFRLSGGSEPG